MTFEIGRVVPPKQQPDSFEVEVVCMSGDADAFETLVVGPFYRNQDEGALENLLELIQRMKDRYPNGRGGDPDRYGYQNVEGFYSWFNDEGAESEEDYKVFRTTVDYETFRTHRVVSNQIAAQNPKGYFQWPFDVTVEDGMEASPRGVEIFYYNEYLIKHEVSVVDNA